MLSVLIVVSLIATVWLGYKAGLALTRPARESALQRLKHFVYYPWDRIAMAKFLATPQAFLADFHGLKRVRELVARLSIPALKQLLDHWLQTGEFTRIRLVMADGHWDEKQKPILKAFLSLSLERVLAESYGQTDSERQEICACVHSLQTTLEDDEDIEVDAISENLLSLPEHLDRVGFVELVGWLCKVDPIARRRFLEYLLPEIPHLQASNENTADATRILSMLSARIWRGDPQELRRTYRAALSLIETVRYGAEALGDTQSRQCLQRCIACLCVGADAEDLDCLRRLVALAAAGSGDVEELCTFFDSMSNFASGDREIPLSNLKAIAGCVIEVAEPTEWDGFWNILRTLQFPILTEEIWRIATNAAESVPERLAAIEELLPQHWLVRLGLPGKLASMSDITRAEFLRITRSDYAIIRDRLSEFPVQRAMSYMHRTGLFADYWEKQKPPFYLGFQQEVVLLDPTFRTPGEKFHVFYGTSERNPRMGFPPPVWRPLRATDDLLRELQAVAPGCYKVLKNKINGLRTEANYRELYESLELQQVPGVLQELISKLGPCDLDPHLKSSLAQKSVEILAAPQTHGIRTMYFAETDVNHRFDHLSRYWGEVFDIAQSAQWIPHADLWKRVSKALLSCQESAFYLAKGVRPRKYLIQAVLSAVTPSDYFAGYVSGDCTKDDTYLSVFNRFAGNYSDPGFLLFKLHEDGCWVGNAYIMVLKDGARMVLFLESLQLTPGHEVVENDKLAARFAERFLDELTNYAVASGFDDVVVSKDPSNYAGIRSGVRAAIGKNGAISIGDTEMTKPGGSLHFAAMGIAQQYLQGLDISGATCRVLGPAYRLILDSRRSPAERQRRERFLRLEEEVKNKRRWVAEKEMLLVRCHEGCEQLRSDSERQAAIGRPKAAKVIDLQHHLMQKRQNELAEQIRLGVVETENLESELSEIRKRWVSDGRAPSGRAADCAAMADGPFAGAFGD